MKDPVNQSEQQRENGGMDNTNPSLLVSEPPLLASEPLQLEENVQPVGHFDNIGLITDAEEDFDPELQALISSPSNIGLITDAVEGSFDPELLAFVYSPPRLL